MTDTSKEALDALVNWLDAEATNHFAGYPADRRSVAAKLEQSHDTITALRQQIADMEASHAQQIAAVEAAATERAADLIHRVADIYPSDGNAAAALYLTEGNVRALIAPEATIALAAREAEVDRAGYLRGIRQALAIINVGGKHAIKNFVVIHRADIEAEQSILALADRAEKGGA